MEQQKLRKLILISSIYRDTARKDLSASKDKKQEELSDKKDSMGTRTPESNDLQTNFTGLSIEKITSEAKEDIKEEASPEKKQETAEQPAASSNGGDISPENLLNVIAQEWNSEEERLKAKYMSGNKKKKEAQSTSLVQSGHAEIEGDTMLFIYGNALEVLNNADFQKNVQQISFQFVRFDGIVDHNNIGKLKKFQNLSKLTFSHNFLHSFVQVAKLECLSYLKNLTIENNDIMKTTLIRGFIVYRFPHIVTINGTQVTETDKTRARKQFQYFDRLLSFPPFPAVWQIFLF